MKKARLAVGYGSICGGCDVAFTDVGTKLADLAEVAEIVYWPAVVDGKIEQLEEVSNIDVGVYFGAVRTDEHETVLRLLEEKSEVLVAFGTCSCYGGIPGLGNVETRESLLATAYSNAPNTRTEGVPSLDEITIEKMKMPKLREYTSSPADLVEFDIFVPGCPPPVQSVIDLIDFVADYVENGNVPDALFVAEEGTVCEYCEREKPDKISIDKVMRVHESDLDENECFLSQGVLCLGPVTRAGCGESPRCTSRNMPCRGCFGPTPKIRDQGTKFLSSIASSIMLGKEKQVSEEELIRLLTEGIIDPVGLFYRFALPVAIINRKHQEK
ncbi:MAG: hypothetical protein ACOC3C_00650 [Candidatus Thorarchaeota archaeon]